MIYQTQLLKFLSIHIEDQPPGFGDKNIHMEFFFQIQLLKFSKIKIDIFLEQTVQKFTIEVDVYQSWLFHHIFIKIDNVFMKFKNQKIGNIFFISIPDFFELDTQFYIVNLKIRGQCEDKFAYL